MKNFITDIELHEDARRCALSTYNEKKFPPPSSCKPLCTYRNPNTGYFGIVYKRGDDIIIASKGTDLLEKEHFLQNIRNMQSIYDLQNDFQIISKNIPSQMFDILSLYNKYKNQGRIILTGDSLAGSCSTILGVLTGTDTVVFNPFGVGEILESYNINYSNTDNIINYCNKNDIVTGTYGDKHIGKVYQMNEKGSLKNERRLYYHLLENQQPITTQKEISKHDLYIQNPIRTHIDKTTRIIEDFDSRLLMHNTNSNIAKYETKKSTNYTNPADFINKDFGGYHNGQVYVKEYKRHDGTKVRAHWRDWPGNFDPNKKLVDMEEPELGHAIDFWLDEDKYVDL